MPINYSTEPIDQLKLLYAIQGTGNGHLARAMEIAPHLVRMAEVDFLISGKAAELKFPYEFKYRYHGIFFIFGKRGGVNYLSTAARLKPLRFLRDVAQCPVTDYDAVINDFEPVSAWAARRRNVKAIAVSHQAAFYSPKVPRHKDRNAFIEYGMRRFAPFDAFVASHYKPYDEDIFLPVIRKELLEATVTTGDKIVVYLPAFADQKLIPHFNKLKHENWLIFSKKASQKYQAGNVTVHPVNRELYSRELILAKAVLMGSGFQGTSEALYLGKKLMTIPMFDQYEQLCNAAALEALGVRIVYKIDGAFSEKLQSWLAEENTCHYRFQPDPEAMAMRILELAQK